MFFWLLMLAVGPGTVWAQNTVRLPVTIGPIVVNRPAVAPIPQAFQLGISRLREQGFGPIAGKRVGLLTHMAATDENGVLTIDILKDAPNVNLVALYGPEHGLEGLAKADEKVEDGTYKGLPVYSLYGQTRKPTREMLQGIDVMMIDLQDVGVRSYTYISAMKLAMQACFEQKIPVIVLDRPNPLGGLKVDGPILDPRFRSYVGSYRIPYVHGLTIGELALVAQAELAPLKGQLSIVKMTGWRRGMLWSDITLPSGGKLKWRATSPAVPTLGAAFGYACTGLGAQLGGFRHGYGSEYPFRFLSHPEISAPELKKRLDQAKIPGMSFQAMRIPDGLRRAGDEGVYVRIDNWQSAGALQLSLTMLQIAQELEGKEPFAEATRNEVDLFNKHWGRAEPLKTLRSGRPLNAWKLSRHWEAEAVAWQAQIRRYWLYN